jgi:hypothetical protein
MTRKGSSAASSPSAALDNGSGVAAGRFICSMCAKVYRSGAGLRYHKRKRHRGRLVLSEKEFSLLRKDISIEKYQSISFLTHKII